VVRERSAGDRSRVTSGWLTVLAVAFAAPLAAVGVTGAATPARADDHDMAVVLRTWEVVPPQADNCFYNGGGFGGPDAYYDDTLTPTCGSYLYTDFLNPEGEHYRYMYNHVSGRHYTFYGDNDPGAPSNVPPDKVRRPDPPRPFGVDRNTPAGEFDGAILGDWRIKPVKVGTWYARNEMTVVNGGYGVLTGKDTDACNWKVGNPVYRNLKGHGPTWTGERYRGPCVTGADAWTPVTITVSSDGDTLTEQVTGYPTPLTWYRASVGLDCGTRGGLTWDQLRPIYRQAATLDAADQDAFYGDTCSAFDVRTETTDVVLADAGTDTAVVAGTAGAAPCKKANFRIRLVTPLNAFKTVEMANYQMSTRFCYDGSKVWQPGRKGFAPEASVEDVQITGWGKAYQMTLLGQVKGTSGYLDDTQGTAETTITTQWSGGLPIIKWAVPENENLTGTLRVNANGTAAGRLGT
jgi:hypothetical protein